MTTPRDIDLVRFLTGKTRAGELKWEPTATSDQFTTSLKGKYSIIVDKNDRGYWMKLRDSDQRDLLTVTNDEGPVDELYHAVARVALNVDAAINEIIGDDIPF